MTRLARFASLFLVAPLLISVTACGGGTSGTTGTGGATGASGSSATSGTGGTASTSSTSGTGGTASTSSTSGTGGAAACGATTCKAGEVCFAKSGGEIMEPQCVADPCAPQPLSCACAASLCAGTLYVCSVVGETVHCDCNTCP